MVENDNGKGNKDLILLMAEILHHLGCQSGPLPVIGRVITTPLIGL